MNIQALKTALIANGIHARIIGEDLICIKGTEFKLSGMVARCERISFRYRSCKEFLYNLHSERIIRLESSLLRRISQDYQSIQNQTTKQI